MSPPAVTAKRRRAPGSPIDQLRATIRAATDVLGEVTADPLLARWIRVFHEMPAEDRAVVVDVLEREVQTRLLSRASEDVTGQAARPNPNARLWVRAHGQEAQRSDLEIHEMKHATLRMLRVAQIIQIPEIHDEWLRATRGALAESEDDTVAVVERLADELVAMIRERAGRGG